MRRVISSTRSYQTHVHGSAFMIRVETGVGTLRSRRPSQKNQSPRM